MILQDAELATGQIAASQIGPVIVEAVFVCSEVVGILIEELVFYEASRSMWPYPSRFF